MLDFTGFGECAFKMFKMNLEFVHLEHFFILTILSFSYVVIRGTLYQTEKS